MSEANSILREIRDFAAALSEAAGRRIKAASEGQFEISYKSGNEIVTSIDLETESYLRSEIAARYPGHYIIGEEHGQSGDPEAEFTWHIDPIDGTRNFARGIAYYNVSLGVVRDEFPVAGAVYDVNESRIYSAHQGGGAECNGLPIRVSDVDNLGKAMVILDYHHSDISSCDSNSFLNLFSRCSKVRIFGAVALDLCLVACGACDILLALGSTKYKSMDIVAGLCILKEAGGVFVDLSGAPFDWHQSRALVGANPHLASAAVQEFSDLYKSF
ncbi:inositol monophosphatase family protein [Planctomycetota bacterium]